MKTTFCVETHYLLISGMLIKSKTLLPLVGRVYIHFNEFIMHD